MKFDFSSALPYFERMSMQTDQIHLNSLVKAPDCLGVAHIFLHPQAIYYLEKKNREKMNRKKFVCDHFRFFNNETTELNWAELSWTELMVREREKANQNHTHEINTGKHQRLLNIKAGKMLKHFPFAMENVRILFIIVCL